MTIGDNEVEIEEEEEVEVESLHDLALKLMDFHGGMWSGLYSVGSCMLANDDHWTDRVEDAVKELEEFARDSQSICPGFSPDDTRTYTEDGKLALELAARLLVVRDRKIMLDSLDEFTQAYLTAACWTTDDNAGSGDYETKGRALPLIETMHPDCLRKCIEDCEKFQRENREDLMAFQPNASQNGHDFWLTRNHHGVGYWDREQTRDPEFEEIADRLTEAAHGFGEVSGSIYKGVFYVE